MATGFYTWLQSAPANGAIDSTINWIEGQAPPTITPSFRSMMAVFARYRDDWGGVKPSNGVMVTTGSANAQVLTTNLSAPSLINGWTLCFRMGYTNSAAATLAVDGLAAKPMQITAGQPLAGGELRAGRTYVATYQQPNDCWLFRDDPGEFPGGTRMPFNQTVSPVGWRKDETAALNNSAMRTVTGTASTGGTANFTDAFAARTILQANLPTYDLTINLTVSGTTTTEEQLHNHDMNEIYGSSEMKQAADGTTAQIVKLANLAEFGSDNDSLAGANHTHTFAGAVVGTIPLGGTGTALDFAVKYRDHIIAQKE